MCFQWHLLGGNRTIKLMAVFFASEVKAIDLAFGMLTH